MSWLNELEDQLKPVADVADRLRDESSIFTSDQIRISKRPAIGTEAYAITLFKGMDSATIERYMGIHSIDIPNAYKDILIRLNGAYIFELNLYGLPPSMTKEPPLLDRTKIQPLDLATANQFWYVSFKAPSPSFHFGSGPYSLEEHVAYFIVDDGIAAYRKGGVLVDSWDGFESFLRSEIVRSEKEFPEYEKFMANARASMK